MKDDLSGWSDPEKKPSYRNGNGNGHKQWKLQKEKTLMYAGLGLIGAAFILFAITAAFRIEFVFAGLTLCGISIAQWGDRKEK